MTSACRLVRWMTRCVTCDTHSDEDEHHSTKAGKDRREQIKCRCCTLSSSTGHNVHGRGQASSCRRGGGKKFLRVGTSSCDPAIVALFGSSNGCPICATHSCRALSSTTDGDLYDVTKGYSKCIASCGGLNTCDISDCLTKDCEMITDHFLLPPAEPICCCGWCCHVRSQTNSEVCSGLPAYDGLPAFEDESLRMRNCLLVQKQEERCAASFCCGQKKMCSRDLSDVVEREATSVDEKMMRDDKKLPAHDEDILRPVAVIPSTTSTIGGGSRELKHRRPLANLQSDRTRLVNVARKTYKHGNSSDKNGITDATEHVPTVEDKDVGGQNDHVGFMDWDGGRSELTRSWVIPAPNRTICHIWDTMPVAGLDAVLSHLSPVSVADGRAVVPPSPVAVRCCCFPAVAASKQKNIVKNKCQNETLSRGHDFISSVPSR